MRKSAFIALCAPILTLASVVQAQGQTSVGPFNYPASALEVPATLAQPPALDVHIADAVLRVGTDDLTQVAKKLGARVFEEGTGDYARAHVCLAGRMEENRMPVMWLVATGSTTISEAQLEWRRRAPKVCTQLPESVTMRLGKAQLQLDEKTALERLGKPSHRDGFGWSFWLSQQFTKNARGLEGLELDWLGLHFDDTGRVDKLFTSFVRNP